MDFLGMTLKADRDWRTDGYPGAFLELLSRQEGPLRPERFGPYEPLRGRFAKDPQRVAALVADPSSRGIILDGPKPHCLTLDLMSFNATFSRLLGTANSSLLADASDVSRLLAFVEELCLWGDVAYGEISHSDEFNAQNSLETCTGGMRLEECLPGVYWANIFGPPYVAFFGRERLLSAPAYQRKELSNGGILLLTAATPFEHASPAAMRLKREIRLHLGEDAFFDREQLDRVCRTPRFTFRPPDSPVVLPIPYAYFFPDAPAFVAAAPALAEALAARMGVAVGPDALTALDKLVLSKARRMPASSQQGVDLIREATAFYGEVLCRTLGAQWHTDDHEPMVTIPTGATSIAESPFIRVYRLWLEKVRADGMAVRYKLIASGEWAKFIEATQGGQPSA